MTVCSGLFTCSGTWEFILYLVLLSAFALTLAYRWGRHMVWGYAFVVIALQLLFERLFSYLLLPVPFFFKLFRYRTFEIPHAYELLGFLLLWGMFFLLWFTPRLRERYAQRFLAVVWGVTGVLVLLFIFLMLHEIASARAAAAAARASGRMMGI